jgi:hypothetical protein
MCDRHDDDSRHAIIGALNGKHDDVRAVLAVFFLPA